MYHRLLFGNDRVTFWLNLGIEISLNEENTGQPGTWAEPYERMVVEDKVEWHAHKKSEEEVRSRTVEDDRGVSEGREDVREVFQQRGSGAKRKLSRCGRNQLGNVADDLTLPEGAGRFCSILSKREVRLEKHAGKKGDVGRKLLVHRDN
ncbi:hypothetical protein Tco_0009390 [Tanacetum coccineum]